MKKKILIRIGSLRHGGAEKVLTVLLKNLPKDKYEIDLLINLNSGKYLKEIPEWVNLYSIFNGEMIPTNRIQDIPVKAYRVILQKTLLYFPFLLYRFKLKNKKYDIEFAAIQGIADAILASPNKSSKKIIWIHSDIFNVKGYTEQKIKSLFQFDKILVISEKIQNSFLELAENDIEKNKIIRIYNPLDTNEIILKSAIQQDKYNFDTQLPVFVMIGTIIPVKGYDRLLRVHKKLIEEELIHKLLIIGDGPDFNKIQKYIKELGVGDTVEMIGYVENPYPYLNGADYFVLSSRVEGFPTVLYEAIVLEKPIIATDVSGAKEMLGNGKLGLIVENSEEGIYKGMREFLEKPLVAEQFKYKIRNFAQPFSLESSVKKIEDILDDL
ncbi:MAG: glycosyltransferase [Moheibacter sp.]